MLFERGGYICIAGGFTRGGNTDGNRFLETEPCQVIHGLGLSSRKKEGLARFGKMREKCGEGSLETHVKDAIGFVEDCI